METGVGQKHEDHGIEKLIGHKEVFAIVRTQDQTPAAEERFL